MTQRGASRSARPCPAYTLAGLPIAAGGLVTLCRISLCPAGSPECQSLVNQARGSALVAHLQTAPARNEAGCQPRAMGQRRRVAGIAHAASSSPPSCAKLPAALCSFKQCPCTVRRRPAHCPYYCLLARINSASNPLQIGKECLLALADPASGLATGTGKTPAEAIQDMEAKGAEKTKELVSRGWEKCPASGLTDGAAELRMRAGGCTVLWLGPNFCLVARQPRCMVGLAPHVVVQALHGWPAATLADPAEHRW